MRVLLIVNPKSGANAAKTVVPKLEEFFLGHNVETEIYYTKHSGDATRRARYAVSSKKAYDAIVACGGDGTVNEVVNGIADSHQALGIIPLGTENVLATEFDIPFAPLKAAKIILAGKTDRIDVGNANGRHFMLMAGVGYDAHVASRLKPMLKKLLGTTAYHITALKELFNYKNHELEIIIDKKAMVKGSYVVAGNTKLYGAELRLTPHADMKDGLLDVCIFKGKDAVGFVHFIIRTFAKKHLTMKEVEYFKAKEVIVKSDKPVLGHVDCELIGNTPITITICPRMLTLIIP